MHCATEHVHTVAASFVRQHICFYNDAICIDGIGHAVQVVGTTTGQLGACSQ